ncbi:outer dynein arm docking complex protein oda protein (macronuclear) [Tetrahymena thermophila SB210]|uniref:Outer dynein arm docking complex protein oda protein n=1 Tax=Tetrahymena thermophila (strain SB210) TaxID=312017 RepID=Q233H6_TETTS|nr:outer dynein arm docking complex protein oda protein [Tetrahymena thermophila SB210]EAR91604.3 outer dynein arm docking complex protein oda protein [Tetrahymena thermophila SB210]7MOQ_Z Chain Z, Outer dynein arm docking complex protein oda protein [Tetrahymena thermophila CU428]|eukprot:XP_001011849.3 outer dynein arm docking complex protein oda protein [Tetrahymena thermophila SB210]
MNENLEKKKKMEELEEYQRKFRNLESDRKAYAEETVALIKKQRGIVDKLKNENQQLKDIISKMNAQKIQQSNTMYGKPSSDSLVEELKQKIEVERRQQMEIEKHVVDFQKKIIEKRSNIGGYNAGAENDSSLAKQIKILENRLDKANQKFNEAIAVNKQLRQQIDSLRRERVIFDNLYKKLEKELHEKRKQMANIIETANTAYEERDRANDQIQNLKMLAKKESENFEKDLRELSHIMEKNKKALDYIKLTEKNRDDNKLNNDLLDSDKFARTTSQKLYKDRNVNQTQSEKIQRYEEDFAKIQAATKVNDFEKLVNTFIENEEKNFQTFKFVNELSNEIEELEKQIGELRSELDQYKGGSNMDIQYKRKIKEFEEVMTRAENKSESYEFKRHDAQKLINSLTNWIETLFNTIECDKKVAKELAGSHSVTDGNMMIFLAIIENKVNQIVQAFSAIDAQGANENYHTLLQNVSNLSTALMANKQRQDAPDNDEFEEEEGEGDRILNIEDFRKKALEKLDDRKQTQQSKKLPKAITNRRKR